MMMVMPKTTTIGVVCAQQQQQQQPAGIDSSTCEDIILSPSSSNPDENSNRRTDFTWSIVVSVSANILCATEEELEEIGQTLLQAYNDVNIFNEDLCDPNTRYVFDYEVQVPTFTTTDQSDIIPSFVDGDGDGGDGRLRSRRRTLTTDDDDTSTKIVRRRQLQVENPTPSPTTSFAPSSSVEFRDDDDDGLGNVDLFFEITGSCSDCGDDDNTLNLLSDDVVRRRSRSRNRNRKTRNIRMLQQGIPDGSNCTCSSDAEDRPPTEEEWLSRFSALVQEEQESRYTFVELTEVEESTCRSELIQASATATGDDDDGGVFSESDTVETVSIDIAQVFGGPDDEGVVVTVSELEEAFVCTYNWFVTRYFCDPSYTSVSSATLLIDGPIVGEEGGSSSSNLTFAVNSTCVNNDCTGRSIFFEELLFGLDTVEVTSSSGGGRFGDGDDGETGGGRWESPSGQCYCPVDGPPRVPTRQEFEDAFGPCLPPLTPSEVSAECPEITTESNIDSIPPASARPTLMITVEPSEEPTEQPTEQPTESPTEQPTESPTPAPTLRKPLVTAPPTYG
eukprot:CAMPEP_0113474934 /NCGR_PEP_ID=MMETSP0014_2-20120614/18851_1 /TAXON_ID=2857 /ORGANISM="Nitzschia sp." /LENGTH=561 /DNA_ID=CAMNT_0000367819 /DNA_START=165 /DNA_END=1846 /DNA_ORIENTATION=+ /assembly_acc=CAM_ASM_000159